MALNTKTSIVDYLKSKNQDSSYSSRSKLAQSHGINGYKGTAQQNTSLLKALQGSTSAPKPTPQPTPKPTVKPTATKTAVTPTPTVTQTPSSPLIDQATQEATNALESYKEFLRSGSDSYFDNQQAQLEQTRNNTLTNLEKALSQAMHEGKISQREAEKQLEQEQQMINADAYRNSQVIDLSAESRGIGNSQQLLAMQQGDQRHASGMRNEARSQRDERINTIKDRLSQIQNSYNLDVTNVNNQYDTGLQGARAQADMQFFQGMSNMQMEQYKNSLQMKSNLTLQEQQHLNTLNQMETQQGYTQDNMNMQHNLDLSKMKTAHGYDMKKIDVQFNNQLTAMAKQYGYDMKKIGTQNANRLAEIKAQKDAQIQAQNDAYEKERQRVKDAYTKGTPEYQIRVAQIDEAEQNAINQYHQEALYESLNTIMKPGQPGYNQWLSNPSSVMNNAGQYLNPPAPAPAPSTSWLDRFTGGSSSSGLWNNPRNPANR